MCVCVRIECLELVVEEVIRSFGVLILIIIIIISRLRYRPSMELFGHCHLCFIGIVQLDLGLRSDIFFKIIF